MKYNKFLTILFASGLLGIAVACTDNFEADNRNKGLTPNCRNMISKNIC